MINKETASHNEKNPQLPIIPQLPTPKPFKTQFPTPQVASGLLINSIISLFKNSINPTIAFENKTQRGAVKYLIEAFGYEKTERMVKYAVSIQGKPYSPVVTTPWELKQKLSKVVLFYQRSVQPDLNKKVGKNYDTRNK